MPIVVLLVGAFILAFIPRLPVHWQTHRLVQFYLAPGVVGLAGVLLLAIRLTTETDIVPPADLLSGWHFYSEGSGAGLMTRADLSSLPFLCLCLAVLLVVTLIMRPQLSMRWPVWILILGASASAVFVSADNLTVGYTILVFDILTAFYWFKRSQPNLVVARLFLGVFTASAALWASLIAVGNDWGIGLALGLRLLVYPLLEAAFDLRPNQQPPTATEMPVGYRYVYWGLSLAMGEYLLVRTWVLSPLIGWIAALIILGVIATVYYKPALMNRFNTLAAIHWPVSAPLLWLAGWGDTLSSRTGKLILRVNVILEGQHYIGWALLTALVGGLIILLQT